MHRNKLCTYVTPIRPYPCQMYSTYIPPAQQRSPAEEQQYTEPEQAGTTPYSQTTTP